MLGVEGVKRKESAKGYLYKKSGLPDSLFLSKGSPVGKLFSIDPQKAGFSGEIDKKGSLQNELFCIDPRVIGKGELGEKKISIDPRRNR